MPRIINAYDGNTALGDSLSKLGEAIYGDQAKNEVYRQKAFETKRGNDNAEPFAAAVRDGNRNQAAYYGALGNHTGQDTADFGRLSAANHASGVDDPHLAVATMGAGGAFGNTAPGQGRELANRSSIAAGNNATTLEAQRISSDRAHQTQMDIDGRTLTTVVDPVTGEAHYEQKSNAVGRSAPLTTDQVKAGVIANALRKVATAQQPQAFPAGGTTPFNVGGPQAQPAAAPARPQGDVFAGMSPQIRQLIGVNTEQPMIDPRTGRTGVSRDSGTTLENGQPATGYIPSSNEAVLAQERDNNVRTQAAAPLPVAPTGYPDTAKDAGLTSGLKSLGQKALNETSGAFGLGEPFAGVNTARHNLENQAQATRELIANAPGRAAVMDKKWADELIPQPNFVGMTGINATEQMNRSVQLTNHLRDMYGIVQQDAINPNTPPAERVKMEAYLRNLGHAIQLREKTTPEGGAAQPAAAAPGAPPTAPAATVVQNGHTYNLQPDGSYQ